MKKKHIRSAIKWAWNLLLVYLVVVFIIVQQDAKANPELYMLIESRPTDSAMQPNDSSLIVPNYYAAEEWEYKANTFSECKPMVHWLGLYNKWIKPMIYVMFVLIVLNILINVKDWDKLKKWFDKENDEKEVINLDKIEHIKEKVKDLSADEIVKAITIFAEELKSRVK